MHTLYIYDGLFFQLNIAFLSEILNTPLRVTAVPVIYVNTLSTFKKRNIPFTDGIIGISSNTIGINMELWNRTTYLRNEVI